MRLISAVSPESRRILRARQQTKIAGENQMILKFAGGTQRDANEAPEIPIARPSASFRNVRRAPDRAARTSWSLRSN